MKIQCQSCQAKYTIADEKVVGKVVKIRCKKCSATIVVNGNELAGAPAEDAAETTVFDYTQSTGQWTVNVADGDQRTLTVAEVVAEYRRGVINDDTYCWRDGMPDWLPLHEIEPLFGAVNLGPPSITADSHSAASLAPIERTAPIFPSSASSPAPSSPSPITDEIPISLGSTGVGEASVAAAARRAGGRALGTDLFGNVEKAGGEEDVMTSAKSSGSLGPAPSTRPASERPTGARNESSVLFSLAALTENKKGAPDSRTTAAGDGSGLIDIRALSASMESNGRAGGGSARVDDIMNLSGGGAFGAALAAPMMAPTPLQPVGVSAAPQPKSNGALIGAILGGCAILAIGIVGAVWVLKSKGTTEATPTTASAVSTPATASAASVAVTPPTSTPSAPATTDTPAAPSSATPAAPAANGPKLAGNTTPSPTPKGADQKVAPTPPSDAPKPANQGKPKSLDEAINNAAGGKKTDSSSQGGGAGTGAPPFDRGAAAAAIGGVDVQSCKKPDGPTGPGHVTIKFGPDGSVQSAVVDSGPFPGTAVGGCIAGKYRSARVPAFSGGPVTVGKSFSVN